VLYLQLIIFSVGGNVRINSETLCVTDFMNLKIKSAQSFGIVHSDRVYVRVFIGVSTHICISIYIYTVFLKKPIVVLGPFRRLAGPMILGRVSLRGRPDLFGRGPASWATLKRNFVRAENTGLLLACVWLPV
jgi:hypothetical protein